MLSNARVAQGRHRAPDDPIDWADELANARDWIRWAGVPAMWVLTIALWLWVTYQSAVIELPPAVAAAATFTAGLAYAAGRSAGRRDA